MFHEYAAKCVVYTSETFINCAMAMVQALHRATVVTAETTFFASMSVRYRSAVAFSRRCLSTVPGGGGTGTSAKNDRGSMSEFMRNLAKKTEAGGPGAAAGDLWKSLSQQTGGKPFEIREQSPRGQGFGDRRSSFGGSSGGRGSFDNNRSSGNSSRDGFRDQGRGQGDRGSIMNHMNRDGGRGGGGRIFNDRNGGGGRGGGGAGAGERRKPAGSMGMPMHSPEMDDDDDFDADGDINSVDYDPAAAAKRRLSKGGYGYDEIEGMNLTERPKGRGGFASARGGDGADDDGDEQDGHHMDGDDEDRSVPEFRMTTSDELLLYDDEFFENADDLDTEEFDAVDTFLAEAFIECMKSEDDTYHMVIEQDSLRRIRLPSTRSMAQLQAFCQPPKLQNSAADSAGAELAAQAWGVIHKNYYYTDSEKYRLVEHVAAMHNKVVNKMASRDESTIDLIFKPGFVKGNRYLEEELRLQRLNTSMTVEVDDRFLQPDTDWSVQAVVDEDQL